MERGKQSQVPYKSLLFTVALLLTAAAPVLGQELAPVKSSLERPLFDNPISDWGPEYTNWVELSFGHFFVDGSKAYFQRRQQLPAGSFGGIESFHYETPVTTNDLLTIDGRAIFDNHDYLADLKYTKEKVGYIRAGYREYRTYYDLSGGWYPATDAWIQPWNRQDAIDRSDIWVELGLRVENVPELTFRYEHQTREGLKDSTSWGDFNVNIGQPGAANVRSIVPAFWNIDEKRDIFEFDLKHTISTTDFGIGVQYETISQDDRRYALRRPGEEATAERRLTTKNGQDIDLFNAHAFTETALSPKLLLTTGYGFTTLDSDVYGSRIYGSGFEAVFDPLFARRQQFDEGFLDLSGEGRRNEYMVNVNLLATPWENVTLLPCVRFEAMDESATSQYISTTVGPAPDLTTTTEELADHQSTDYIDVSESLEARYTGFTNWLFYVRGEWAQYNGDLHLKERAIGTGELSELEDKDIDRLTQKYIAGLTWYPLRRLNLASQYYHKIRDVDYKIHVGDPTGYPGFIHDQGFNTDDVNFRVTIRPLTSLSFVTRYDFQLSTFDMVGTGLDEIQSAESTTHIISENVSWTPLPGLYLQGHLNYVLDSTETPAVTLPGLEGLVQRSDNDYWNAGGLAGYQIAQGTDVQLQYFYYRADNFHNNSAVGQPYGADAEEHGVTVTLTHEFSKAMRGTLKYGYFSNRDVTYGGHKDYTAHLIYASMQYRF